MKTEFCFGRGVINLPAACLHYVKDAPHEYLRVLLALASGRAPKGVQEITGLSEETISEALLYWKKTGILADGEDAVLPAQPFVPVYTGADMLRIAEETDIRELSDVCRAILGKEFTPAEEELIYRLYDSMRLEFEYVVLLCKYCHDIGRPSMRYVEKTAIDLYDRGITTVSALTAHIENEEKKGDVLYQIRKLFGIGERALTEKEDECLTKWVIDWQIPYELIALAYDKMMTNPDVKKPSFAYEHTILKEWHEAGIQTRDEAEAHTLKVKETKKKAKKEAAPKEIGFDLDEFFNAATLRGEESSERR